MNDVRLLIVLFSVSLVLSLVAQEKPIPNSPPRFWVCLHWAHPDGIEWTSTIINGEDQWEYLQEKYPGSYRGKCDVE